MKDKFLEHLLGMSQIMMTLVDVEELRSYIAVETARLLEAQSCSVLLQTDAESKMALSELSTGVSDTSRMNVPLISRDHAQVMGQIVVVKKNPVESDNEILAEIAKCAAPALENCLLFAKLRQEIIYLSEYDALTTKLPNRKYFKRQLDYWIDGAGQTGNICLLFLDLDDFRLINEQYGHTAGDQLLFDVAQRLAYFAKDNGSSMLARLGGDEFGMILNKSDRPASEEIAQSILRLFEQPFSVEGVQQQITTSIGLSLYPQDGQASVNLLQQADKAMYQAKRQGKNIYRFYVSS